MTFDEEDLLKKWLSHAAVFKWLHDRSSKHFSKKSKFISIPILIFNTTSGMTIFTSNMFKDNNTHYLIFELIIGSLNIMCLVLSGLRDYCKYAEMVELHIQSYKQWTKFKNDIYVELVVPSIDRKEFVNQIKMKYIDLISISPYIPNCIIFEYEKKIGNNGWSALPDIIDGVTTLQNSCNQHNIIDLDDNR